MLPDIYIHPPPSQCNWQCIEPLPDWALCLHVVIIHTMANEAPSTNSKQVLWHKAEYKDIAMYQQVLNAEWAKIPNYSVIHCTVVQCENFDHHVDIEQMCKAVIVACIHSSNVCIYRQLRRLMQRSTNAYLAGKNMYVLSISYYGNT